MIEHEDQKIRKIIHVDMDCFYAAIEVRDNPSLEGKPVAVGGSSDQRGVLCTCNYVARQYGVRSAMPTATALKLCKDLILLPVNINKYQAVAARVHRVFAEFTDLVEPLSLDEAYLEVTNSPHQQGSATRIAEAIRARIWETEQLTASAGVAPNKFLAKIASGWKKPNGLFVIKPQEVQTFVKNLQVEELFGVGKVTAEKLHQAGLKTCADVQKLSFTELINQFGKLGHQLYYQSRGIDQREVNPHRERKSLSVEHTFSQDIYHKDHTLAALTILYEKLLQRLTSSEENHPIKSQFIKIKLANFRILTAETVVNELGLGQYQNLCLHLLKKINLPIRLLGIGVHFAKQKQAAYYQYSLPFD